MSELQILMDTPIGAVFFVSGAISVFILLAIFIAKKGTDFHSMLGYVFLFGLCFSNYAAAMAFYEGLLPLAAISITIPVSTVSIIFGIAAIVPKSKSLLRIRLHIISMCVSTISVVVGTLVNWYHFNINPLGVFRWSDVSTIVTMSIPILIIGGLITFYFLSDADIHYESIHGKRKTRLRLSDEVEDSKIGVGSQSILLKSREEQELEEAMRGSQL